HQHIVAAHHGDAVAVQPRKTDRDRIIGVGLAGTSLRVDPHPGSQLRRHVQHQLAIRDKALGQQPARAVASLNSPATLPPLPGEATQLPIARHGVGEPRTCDYHLRDRVENSRGVTRLVRIDADHHAVIHHVLLTQPTRALARRAMQLPAAQTSLEPQPRRGGPSRPQAVRKPERQQTTAADYRASPPSPTPEDLSPQPPRPTAKQVADYEPTLVGC